MFFYPGSSIGNFAPEQAIAFLRRLRANADSDGGVLIGVDLVKDDAILDAAYDDALGVTAAFNLNMLRHVNGLIGADFDVRAWRHHGFFNAGESRVEMHLEARSDQVVRIGKAGSGALQKANASTRKTAINTRAPDSSACSSRPVTPQCKSGRIRSSGLR